MKKGKGYFMADQGKCGEGFHHAFLYRFLYCLVAA